MYQIFIRPILFLFDPEKIHHLILRIGNCLWRHHSGRALTRIIYTRKLRSIPTRLGPLSLPNPIGLAAGFDKNANLVPGIETLGFGFVEIGTVTPRAQLGNPSPRIFREQRHRALVNRMGFNNDGAETIASRLKKVKKNITVPLGINIGKNRDTPISDAVTDYEKLLKTFNDLADYFVINVSSPNTPGLKTLQSQDFLKILAEKIKFHQIKKPIFIKLAPDLLKEDLKSICGICGEGKVYSGLVLTNTIPTDLGGLSGPPLKEISLSMLKEARQFLEPTVPIISVGGIETSQDVKERLSAGANAVQLYTALIYQGPGLPSRILHELLQS